MRVDGEPREIVPHSFERVLIPKCLELAIGLLPLGVLATRAIRRVRFAGHLAAVAAWRSSTRDR